MAIESVQHVELVFPLSKRKEVLRELHAAEVLHIDEPGEEVIESGAERVSVSTAEIDNRIAALSAAVELLESYKGLTPKKGLIESFFGVAPPATREDLVEAGNGVDIDAIGELAGRLRDRARGLAKSQSDTESELVALRPFVGLSFNSAQMRVPSRTTVLFGQMTPDGFNALRLDAQAGTVACEEARRQKKAVYVLAAFRPGDRETALEKLREHGFDEVPLPVLECSVEERIERLHRKTQELDRERGEIREEAAGLAVDYDRIVKALAFWEDKRELSEAAAKTAATRRSGMITGWVRSREAYKLNRLLSERLDYCSAELREPLPDEEPPVSIRLPALLRPMSLLIKMFGLPGYRSFDPTAYLTLSFLVFFGFCFGDVVYGAALIIISSFIMIKYKDSWLKNFFQLFLYAGIASLLFGLVTWTWLGDYLSNADNKYVSADGFIYKFSRFFAYFKWEPGPNDQPLLDPLNNPLAALLLALGLGVINQFYGIVMKIKLELQRKDYAAALFDGGLWLVVLPGVLILISTLFTRVPADLITVGWGLFLAGSAGLILTQGRKEKGLLAKAITGVVSIYGILGSYGITGFIGDMLSYSRLLALGLTTTIIGMSFNIIADLCGSFGGLLLFVLVLIGGHAFNFVMSILGAFVHPARLILMEFFGRFYEAGGDEFVPLGLKPSRVELVERKCVRAA